MQKIDKNLLQIKQLRLLLFVYVVLNQWFVLTNLLPFHKEDDAPYEIMISQFGCTKVMTLATAAVASSEEIMTLGFWGWDSPKQQALGCCPGLAPTYRMFGGEGVPLTRPGYRIRETNEDWYNNGNKVVKILLPRSQLFHLLY